MAKLLTNFVFVGIFSSFPLSLSHAASPNLYPASPLLHPFIFFLAPLLLLGGSHLVSYFSRRKEFDFYWGLTLIAVFITFIMGTALSAILSTPFLFPHWIAQLAEAGAYFWGGLVIQKIWLPSHEMPKRHHALTIIRVAMLGWVGVEMYVPLSLDWPNALIFFRLQGQSIFLGVGLLIIGSVFTSRKSHKLQTPWFFFWSWVLGIFIWGQTFGDHLEFPASGPDPLRTLLVYLLLIGFSVRLTHWSYTNPKGSETGPKSFDALKELLAEKEQILQKEHAMLHGLVGTIPDWVYFKDKDHKFVLVNQAMADNLEAGQVEQVYGKTDFDYFAEDEAERFHNDEDKVIESGEAIVEKEEQEKLRGKLRWTLTTKAPWYNEQGEIIGVIGLGRDITTKKTAEQKAQHLNKELETQIWERSVSLHQKMEELNRERELLTGIIDHIPDPIFVKNREGVFIVANRAMAETLGLEEISELTGKRDTDFNSPEEVSVFRGDDKQVMSTMIPVLNREERNTVDGLTTWFSTTKVPWLNEHGEVEGIIGISREITKQKKSHVKILQMNKDLEARVQKRTEDLHQKMAELNLALEVTRLKEEEIRHINEVAKAINATLDVEKIMNSVVDALSHIFQFNQTGIILIDPESNTLRLQGLYGREVTPQMVEDLQSFPIPIEKVDNAFAWTIKNMSPFYVSPINEESKRNFSPVENKIFEIAPIQSLLLCPLAVQNETIGIMTFSNTHIPFNLTEEDIEKAQRYTTQMATAIRNSQVHQKEQDQKQQLHVAMQELEGNALRLNQELEMASHIQEGILPESTFKNEHLEIVTYYESMGEVGGDLFNFLPMADGRIGVLIADAIGHGIPAAFITMMAQITLNGLSRNSTSPRYIFRRANQMMDRVLKHNEFITAFLAVIEPDGKVVYGSANHPPALVLRKGSDEIEEWYSRGMFLGFFNDEEVGDRYQEKESYLAPGDRVLIFTDGLTEAHNGKREQFGDKRLRQMLLDNRHRSLETFKSTILEEWEQHVKGQPIKDDVTFMILDYS